jgi:hypothetical protein
VKLVIIPYVRVVISLGETRRYAMISYNPAFVCYVYATLLSGCMTRLFPLLFESAGSSSPMCC